MASEINAKFHVGMICLVKFALGQANVRLLPWHHSYYQGGVIWQVEDSKTGHQDMVGEEWLIPTGLLTQ